MDRGNCLSLVTIMYLCRAKTARDTIDWIPVQKSLIVLTHKTTIKKLPKKVMPKAFALQATIESVHRLWKELKARMEFPDAAMMSSVRDRFINSQLKGVRS